MAYPVVWSTGDVQGNSYADVPDVQAWFMSMRIGKGEWASINAVKLQLINISTEIDAVLLKMGAQVPPPPGSSILNILRQTAAVGAAAIIEHARYESGDDSIEHHSQSLNAMYDAQMGLLERMDVPADLMGAVSAGWLPTSDVRKYYNSGNLDLDRSGNAKKPFFTAQDNY